MNIDNREEVLSYFQKISNTSISYAVKFEAKKKGKNVLVVGATHGNEKVGVETAIDYIEKFKNSQLILESGSISFLISNPDAFLENKRYIERDMNRSFFENLDGKFFFEAKRINEIKTFLDENPFDILIDLHSVSRGDFKILVYNAQDERIEKFLEDIACLDLHFLYKDEHIPNTLMQEAFRRGILSFAIECGNHNSNDAFLVAKEQIDAILIKFNMINEYNLNFQKKVFSFKKYETIDKIKVGNNFNFLIENLETETFLKKDMILSFDDDNGHQVIKEDCYVFMPSKIVLASNEDAGFLCKLKKI